jgi:pyridoxine 5-phosphate synthase
MSRPERVSGEFNAHRDRPSARCGLASTSTTWPPSATPAAAPTPIRCARRNSPRRPGADGITAHLREDRRHISDADIEGLMDALTLPLNFEMAATDEMQAIALRHRPHAVCIVPERREESTTEGGLDVARDENRLAQFIAPLREAGCRVSIFIAADRTADRGRRAHRRGGGGTSHRRLLRPPCRRAPRRAGCRAFPAAEMAGLRPRPRARGPCGARLTYDTVAPVAALPEVVELNIGHFLIGEAIFRGLDPAIREMRRLMDEARAA